ncbi:MAG: hypothetical protein WAL25_12420 [Acidimicrobiia bacterium]
MKPSAWGAALLGVLVAGGLGVAGYGLYHAGYSNGLAQTASEVVVRGGPPFYPGFGIFFGFIFLLFLFGFVGRMFMWGRGGPRGWRGDGVEERLEDWHRAAHSGDRTRGYRGDPDDTA